MRILIASPFLLASTALPAPVSEPALRFVFEETVTLDANVTFGTTVLGPRTIVPITGGTFAGPGFSGEGIKGTVLPGGWDWQLRLADGCTKIHADYMLRTDDGAMINVVNEGVSCRARDPRSTVRTRPVFEVSGEKYSWLGRNAFVGTLDPVSLPDGKRAVRIRFYVVS